MSTTREIITLQFGSYANHIGTHFWNLQEFGFDYVNPNGSTSSEVNHDILYREGKTLNNQVTYTPRLLLLDLKCNLGGLSLESNLYKTDTNACEVNWPSNQVTKIEAPPYEHNELQKDLKKFNELKKPVYDLNGHITTWSDFMYTQFHPRTVNYLSHHHYNNDPSLFRCFDEGVQLWTTSNCHEDFFDKIRRYSEECESLQGFQFIYDANNAFSGLSSACIEQINDEFNKTMFVMPVMPSYYDETTLTNDQITNNSLTRTVNLMLSYSSIMENSSLIVPLSVGDIAFGRGLKPRTFDGLKFDHTNPYETSAILSAAIDTLTLAYRKKSSYDMIDMCRYLFHDSGNRKIACASLAIPFPLQPNQYLIDMFNESTCPSTQSISPSCAVDTDYVTQVVHLRGVPEKWTKKAERDAGKQRELMVYRCRDAKQMIEYSYYSQQLQSRCQANITDHPLKIQTPFPQFFTENISANGFIGSSPRDNQEVVKTLPMMSGLHLGPGIGTMLKSLCDACVKIRPSRMASVYPMYQKDDFNENLNGLLELSDEYKPYSV